MCFPAPRLLTSLKPVSRDELLPIAPSVADGIVEPLLGQVGVVAHDDLKLRGELADDVTQQAGWRVVDDEDPQPSLRSQTQTRDRSREQPGRPGRALPRAWPPTARRSVRPPLVSQTDVRRPLLLVETVCGAADTLRLVRQSA